MTEAEVRIQPGAAAEPCDCGVVLDGERCIEGRVYEPCGWADCAGVCDPGYRCDCPCHDLPGAPAGYRPGDVS